MTTQIHYHDQTVRWITLSLFIIGSLFIFSYAMFCLSLEEKPLECKIDFLNQKKEKILYEVQLLRDMTQSLNDPSADEYALIMRQGKIPEGYRRIELKDTQSRQSEE